MIRDNSVHECRRRLEVGGPPPLSLRDIPPPQSGGRETSLRYS